LAIVGQSPGVDEARQGQPFVGVSGQLLRAALKRLNVDATRVFIANAVSCGPPPDGFEFDHKTVVDCARRHLHPALYGVQPKVILTLGNEAHVALHHSGSMSGVEPGAGQIRLWGKARTVRGLHPAAVLRQPDLFGAFFACLDRAVQLVRGEFRPLVLPRMHGTLSRDDCVAKLRQLLQRGAPVAFDIETQGASKTEALDEYRGALVGVAFSDGDLSFFVPLCHAEGGYGDDEELGALLRQVLTELPTITANGKFDCRWIERHLGFRPNLTDDVLPMHHLFDETRPHGLQYISRWLLNAPDWKDELQEALNEQAPERKGNHYVDLQLLGQYAARDAYCTWRCCDTMRNHPRFFSFLHHSPIPLYTDLTQPLLSVLLDIETAGLRVDREALAPTHDAMQRYIQQADAALNAVAFGGVSLSAIRPPMIHKRLQQRVEQAQEKHPDWGVSWDGRGAPKVVPSSNKAKSAAKWLDKTVEYMAPENLGGTTYMGLGIQPSSDAQMRWVLYEWLGLSAPKKTDSGEPSVDRLSLGELRGALRPDPLGDPAAFERDDAAVRVIEALQQRRKIAKLDGTYVLRLLNKGLIKDDGRVHPYFGFDPDTETVARTGRLAARDPNLQNQPESLRPLYVPEPGCKFIEADFGQMELRCLASISRDRQLLDALAAEDVHTAVTSQIFEVPYEQVDKDLRKTGKTMNFAILYGMGAGKMATTLNITKERAEALIAKHRQQFPEVNRLIDYTHQQVKDVGFVVSPLGRVRRLPAALFLKDLPKRWDDLDGKGGLSECLRQGFNSLVQGLAADITNLALIRLSREITGYKDWWRIVNTVHDSVLVEVEAGRAEELAEKMQDVLTAEPYPGFGVPLVVDVTINERWGGELRLDNLLQEGDDVEEDEEEDEGLSDGDAGHREPH
jgi:uracil-DNA glycosylase family 4